MKDQNRNIDNRFVFIDFNLGCHRRKQERDIDSSMPNR